VDSFPLSAQLLASFPQLVPVFSQVGPGLADYKPLVDTMQANVSNYQQVDSLPNFRLFTWFFEVPGILIAVLALLGLALVGVSDRFLPLLEGGDDSQRIEPFPELRGLDLP